MAEIGFVGLGKMGGNMVTRLRQRGHRVVVQDVSPERARQLAEQTGAQATVSLAELVQALAPPRAVWVMVPAGAPTSQVIGELASVLAAGDVLLDGGNSRFSESIARAKECANRRISFLDVGTSGGVWGLANGYCMMIGGDAAAVTRLAPIFTDLAPLDGWLHAGPSGAGHFAKMVHNGIEYGMMQAYAEGFELLRASGYDYDLQKLTHLWNQGSVVRSWLLELAERAFARDPRLEQIRGWVEDSGEGRWTVEESIARAVPAPVLTLALQMRFRSRQEDSFAARVCAALRNEFGGHAVKPSEKP
jgi:6-phosphogluconate dehydrogenase